MLLNGIRADIVLEVMTLFYHIMHIEPEVYFLAAAVEVMEDAQLLGCIHFGGLGTQSRKPGGQFRSHTGEVGSCFCDVLFADGYRDILLLDNAVACGGLVHDDIVILPPEAVKIVTLQFHQYRFFKVFPVEVPVVDGDFCGSTAVQTIYQSGIGQKHLPLGGFRCHHVIDVGEFEGLGIPGPHQENAIGPDPFNGDNILHPFGDTVGFLIHSQNLLDRFHASLSPPFRVW